MEPKRLLLLVLLACSSITSYSHADTITVDGVTEEVLQDPNATPFLNGEPNHMDAYCGLNEAISAANGNQDYSGCELVAGGEDHVIVLPAGEVKAAEMMAITSNIRIVGEGTSETTIVADPGAGFWVQSLGGNSPGFVLQNLTITTPTPAGCVRVGAGTLYATNVHLEGCSDALYTYPNTSAELVNSSIANSTQHAVFNLGSVALSSCLVEDSLGLGISNDGVMVVQDSLVRDNQDSGVFNTGVFQLEDSVVQYNQNSGIRNDGGSVLLLSSTVSDNTTQNGGAGLFNSGGCLDLRDSLIDNNTCQGACDGGGVLTTDGGVCAGLQVPAALQVMATVISNNTAQRGGGIALLADGGTSGQLWMERTSVIRNGADGEGGGLFSDGQFNMFSSTFSANTSQTYGGGIYQQGSGEVHFRDNTVVDNSAAIDGGGFYAANGSNSYISRSIIANNWAPAGAGVDLNLDAPQSSGLTWGSSLLISNSAGLSIGNFGENPTPHLANPIVVADPELGPLTQVNGLWVHFPLPGSPVIDGLAATTDTDAFGRTRNFDGDNNGTQLADFGAVEYDPATDGNTTTQTVQLLPDPTFESGTAGWNGSWGTNISATSEQAESGNLSLRIGGRDIGTWQGAEFNLLGEVEPGDLLEVEASLRISGDPSEPVQITRRSVCAGSTGPAYQEVATGTATDQGWVTLSGTLIVPACELEELVVYVEGPRTGVVMYVDNTTVSAQRVVVNPEPSTYITGSYNVQTDWGSGYCVDLFVTNNQSEPTTAWVATLNLNGTVLTGAWNLDTSASTGEIAITPAQAWNSVIAPGQTLAVGGFCANRAGGSSLPADLSVAGLF